MSEAFQRLVDAEKAKIAANREQRSGAARTGTGPVEMTPEERAARHAGSLGAQVVLDPNSLEAIAARGGAGATITENTDARNAALVARAGGPDAIPVTHMAKVRDPVGDPEAHPVLVARGVEPSEPHPTFPPVPTLTAADLPEPMKPVP